METEKKFGLFIGEVRGSIKLTLEGGQYAQFLSIPYAEPPIGNLRFARPQPYTNIWNASKIRDGTKRPSKCLQIEPETDDVIGSEDCLFLNIFAPSKILPSYEPMNIRNCELFECIKD